VAWRAAQPVLNPARLVFIDESGFSTNMARRYGRCRRGRRLIGRVPHGHWQTSTLVAGLRLGGVVAPCVIDHAMNGATFRAWVEQMLAPQLSPGDVVVMDNLGSHKVAGIRTAIEARGATLQYLPPYSPDLNPIEQLFAKLKATVRRLAPRTLDALWLAIASAVAMVTSAEPANFLANSGYPRLM
jgi:transposase